MIEVEEKEIDRREKELQATVKSPAEAESYRVQTVAEANKWVQNYSLLSLSTRIHIWLSI